MPPGMSEGLGNWKGIDATPTPADQGGGRGGGAGRGGETRVKDARQREKGRCEE